MNMYFCF